MSVNPELFFQLVAEAFGEIFPALMVPLGIMLGLGILGTIVKAFQNLLEIPTNELDTNEKPRAVVNPPQPQHHQPEPERKPEPKRFRPACAYCGSRFTMQIILTATNCPKCGAPIGGSLNDVS